jgi:hypothetical protein
MTLLRNSVATKSNLPFSRNATTGHSLECQSEVARRHDFAESQRDGRCKISDLETSVENEPGTANPRINREGLRSGTLPLALRFGSVFNHE